MSSSKSSAKSSTKTESYDQRILAEQGAVVIHTQARGKRSTAALSIDYSPTDIYSPTTISIDEFSNNVAAAFDALIDFADETTRTASRQVTDVTESALRQVGDVTETASRQIKGTLDFAQDIASTAGGLIKGALGLISDIVSGTGEQSTKQVESVTQALSQELERKATLIPTAVTQILPYMAIGMFAIAGIIILKRK